MKHVRHGSVPLACPLSRLARSAGVGVSASLHFVTGAAPHPFLAPRETIHANHPLVVIPDTAVFTAASAADHDRNGFVPHPNELASTLQLDGQTLEECLLAYSFSLSCFLTSVSWVGTRVWEFARAPDVVEESPVVKEWLAKLSVRYVTPPATLFSGALRYVRACSLSLPDVPTPGEESVGSTRSVMPVVDTTVSAERIEGNVYLAPHTAADIRETLREHPLLGARQHLRRRADAARYWMLVARRDISAGERIVLSSSS